MRKFAKRDDLPTLETHNKERAEWWKAHGTLYQEREVERHEARRKQEEVPEEYEGGPTKPRAFAEGIGVMCPHCEVGELESDLQVRVLGPTPLTRVACEHRSERDEKNVCGWHGWAVL